jgi:hypothetical protein
MWDNNPLAKVEVIDYPASKKNIFSGEPGKPSFSIRVSHHRGNRWVLAAEVFLSSEDDVKKYFDKIQMNAELQKTTKAVKELSRKQRHYSNRAWRNTNKAIALNKIRAAQAKTIPDIANVRNLVRLGMIIPLTEDGKHRVV